MKLSRRGAMGATIGGITAGPDIIRNAVSNAKDTPSATREFTGAGTAALGDKISDAAAIEGKKQYIAGRIKKLTAIVDGDFSVLDGWEQEQLDRLQLEHNKTIKEINSLKSVAESHKEQMYINYRNRSIKERFIRDAVQELKMLLSPTEQIKSAFFGKRTY